MASVAKIIEQMKGSPTNISFNDLLKVCSEFFERKPSSGGSHIVFKTPWKGDPRINIQKNGDKAKAYQVRQVLEAIDKLNSLK
ncbi:toxin HicA [Advenella alkanexedens]|uniref:toxin HicA n=1 Tax=Advenella alkanexedens TaxID=1481665 RepID=UPI0026751096|nr:toxin HicA [Advenella alkanexedens]WKU18750.1 toxin HicA [Advenella alkanexedens]